MELVSGGRFLGISGYQRCLAAHADLSTSPKVSAICSEGLQLPVCVPAIWPAHSSLFTKILAPVLRAGD